MKKLFLAALSVLSFTAMDAQTTNVEKTNTELTKTRAESIEARAQRDVDALDKQLAFTPEQKQKAYDVVLAKINKQIELRKKYTNRDDNTQAEKRKEELTTIKEEYNAGIKSILTPTQVEKFNTLPQAQ